MRDLSYDSVAPLPFEADGGGASMTLVNPSSVPDHSLASNWQASGITGGTPGGAEVAPQSYGDWATATGAGDPDDDQEGDRVSNALEWLLGGDPFVSSPEILPSASVQSVNVSGVEDDYLTITFTHLISAEGVTTTAQLSPDLVSWQGGPGFVSLVSRVYHGDGTATSTFRSATPIDPEIRQFIRAQFETGL